MLKILLNTQDFSSVRLHSRVKMYLQGDFRQRIMLLILILCTCSAILYLNEDFEGGEFIFATDLTAKTVQVCLI
jgi:hypothetical protein